MKTIELFAAACVLLTGGEAFAQLAVLPPPSALDGSPILNLGVNAGVNHWENPATLGAFRVSGDDTVSLASLSNIPGQSWGSTVPAGIGTELSRISIGGGSVRAIFVGETAGWLNDFGYTRTGVVTGSDAFTAFRNIQSVQPATVQFGDHLDVFLLPGDLPNLDFWYNASGSFTTDKRTSTPNGGLYKIFNRDDPQPIPSAGHVLFSQSPLMVSTWSPSAGAYQDVLTYLVAIEDWPSDRGGDGDYTDFIFGLQFFEITGHPLGDTPVPESSTFGLIGGVGLIGLAAWRRRKSGNFGGFLKRGW